MKKIWILKEVCYENIELFSDDVAAEYSDDHESEPEESEVEEVKKEESVNVQGLPDAITGG